jgi:plastocyanin
MKRLLGLLFACAVLALGAIGCGGDDNSDSGSGGGGGGGNADQPAPTAEDNGGASAGGGGGTGAGTQVTMKDIKFNPGSVTVKPGGKVTWTNDDSVGHDVTSDTFNSGGPGGIDAGSTFSHVFKKAGTYKYVCTVHPGMEGTVKVKK